MIKAITAAYMMLGKHGFADIMQNPGTGEKSLHSNSFFDKEDVICEFNSKRTLESPTYLTIQTGLNKHIILEPDFLQFVNHSCSPNIFFDTHSMQLLALKEIQPGDELLFFYPSTEWEMAQPFDCFCGSSNCLRHVNGAAQLNEQDLAQYRLTRFIHEQLENRKKP